MVGTLEKGHIAQVGMVEVVQKVGKSVEVAHMIDKSVEVEHMVGEPVEVAQVADKHTGVALVVGSLVEVVQLVGRELMVFETFSHRWVLKDFGAYMLDQIFLSVKLLLRHFLKEQ